MMMVCHRRVLQILAVTLLMVARPHALQNLKTSESESKTLNGKLIPSLSKFATIIAMDMRLPDNEQERRSRLRSINAHTAGTDVFLCTDEEAANVTDDFENVVLRRFVSADELHTQSPPEFIQWWRFTNCYHVLNEFAREHHHEYEFIFKTRIDVQVNMCVADIAQMSLRHSSGSTSSTIFANSDYVFGGPPSAMKYAATLLDERNNYIGTCPYLPYTSDEIDLLFASDWAAAKFECLSFPMEAVANICDLTITFVDHGPPWRTTNLKPILLKNARNLTVQQKGDCSNALNICNGIYGGSDRDLQFRSERAFLRHLLKHGVLIKQIDGAKVEFLLGRLKKTGEIVERRIFETETVQFISSAKEKYCHRRR